MATHILFSHIFRVYFSDNALRNILIYFTVPYFCAEGDIGTAINACMIGVSETPDMNVIYQKTADWEQEGKIDSVINLKDSPVFVYHGSNDNRVNLGKWTRGTYWEISLSVGTWGRWCITIKGL